MVARQIPGVFGQVDQANKMQAIPHPNDPGHRRAAAAPTASNIDIFQYQFPIGLSSRDF